MAVKKNFLDRFSERLDDMDANSRQAYILRLAKERGFFETVFNAVDEGIMVIDRRLRIRYFNRAARELLGLPEDMADLRVSQLLQGVDWKRILQEDEEEWIRFAVFCNFTSCRTPKIPVLPPLFCAMLPTAEPRRWTNWKPKRSRRFPCWRRGSPMRSEIR